MTPTETRVAGQRSTPAVAPIAEQARRTLICLAESDLPILLMGEHGVGKRATARELHSHSRRLRQPFREFSCADLDIAAIRSFSDMNGTAYMAEVGDLNPTLQEIILEDYCLANQAQGCRLIFGCSGELLEHVHTLRMREDFYYFVSAVTLRLAPLRARKREILNIADLLLMHYSKQFERPKPALTQDAIDFLIAHTWPDNFPELETAMKTFVAIGDQAISLAALRAAAPLPRSNGHRESLSLKAATRRASMEIERRLISEALGSTGGNRKRAAHELGISYKTLLYKIKQTGLEDLSTHSPIGDTI